MLNFLKYQGAGNDFIMVDNRNGQHDGLTIGQIQKVCDRRFGIGADGLIKINQSKEADFEVDYYNADGSKSFCGNGARCSIAFVKHLGMNQTSYSFVAIDGLHEAFVADNLVHLKMNDVSEVKSDGNDLVIHTGSPHYIQLVDNLDSTNVYDQGKAIRYNKTYEKEGINVNFIRFLDANSLRIRTYERGVEDETLSCGTGITAAALALAIHKGAQGKQEVFVKAQGGDLRVTFDRVDEVTFQNIWLIGPAEYVFSGEIDV